MLGKIAREEEERGKRVWITHGRIKIDNIWWRWDEEVEMLRGDRGNVKEIQQGGRGRKKEERRRVKRERRDVGKEERGEGKMMFWNVTGLKNKDRSFWMGLKGWDVIMISETWVEERDWKKIKKGLEDLNGGCNGRVGRAEGEEI